MRQLLKSHLKGRKTPLIMAHAGGLSHGRENSVDAVLNSSKYVPDIVEIDVRKTKDNALLCYHGSIPFGLALAQFFCFLTESTIRRLIGQVNTLSDIIESVSVNSILYLDIKDSKINSEDISSVLKMSRKKK